MITHSAQRRLVVILPNDADDAITSILNSA